MKKLAIISHTTHYLDKSGKIVGWGPTVREINQLLEIFEEVYHCAPLHDGQPPGFALSYTDDRVKFVPLLPSGGRRFIDKLFILFKAPRNIIKVIKTLKNVDVFQFRSPTGMGIYMIPFLNYLVRKDGWFKYAGNWKQKNPPLGYRIQRFLLENQRKKKVTINGKWEHQPTNILTFENPCLYDIELRHGYSAIESKNYDNALNFCFVGRLESAKGVALIIEAFKQLNGHKNIGIIHLIGDGDERLSFEKEVINTKLDIRFHGFINRDEVAEIMKESHFLLLPSMASEGFPKVIAEAANYGCIPIVSNVSSITQYVKDGINGKIVYLENDDILKDFVSCLEFVLNGPNDLKKVAFQAHKMAKFFTYSHYNKRIMDDILNINYI